MGHSQRTHNTQSAITTTTTRVSMQQLFDAQLLELGEDELFQRVEDELNENVALELDNGGEAEKYTLENDLPDGYDDNSDDKKSDIDDTPTLSWDSDNEVWISYSPEGDEPAEIPIGETKSFVDDLLSQISEHNLADEKQTVLVKYLIGSLNDNGYIDRQLASISDDLLFQHNIDASVDELEAALSVLQSFDPPGIGARDLQECLRLQLDRKIEETPKTDNPYRLMVLSLARKVVVEYFNLFKSKDQLKLFEALNVSSDLFDDVNHALLKLNPRPGLSLNEGVGDHAQTVIPDFIIETDVDGHISFSLRDSRIPQLRVSQSYRDLIQAYEKGSLTRSQKENLKYVKPNVERAECFIEAIRKRRDTLYRTMKAIIRHQRAFMLSQDDNDLQPLTGGEIAKAVGVDDSTISRAISDRYVLLDGKLYPLKHFLLRTRRNAKGEDVLRPQVSNAIRDVIDREDKQRPLRDSEISEILISRGLNIKRRTVAKYRDQLGIPVAKMRRSF